MNHCRATHRATAPTALAVTAAATVLVLTACSGDGDGTEATTTAEVFDAPLATEAPAVSGNVDAFSATATAAGWSCLLGTDPFTGQPGATCSPGAGDTLTRAVFAVFDRDDVADGAQAAQLARESTVEELAKSGTDVASDFVADQFLPLDSDTLSGYCVNTLGTCSSSGFDDLGLTLG
ncbi:hypothetical protein [Corynebacterium terpenotabidum]|uniref:Secreted protein n=1 Tax=Corynebacterium terpenotabidum Y-11 TaxID=1200352 RepID=S4XBJ9_9CORY|nr:hypothetical protein [Corynebacterium terpenotabidum]AGP29849.1 hypothetical protein A606_00970 [Corynebacterium terpenotabidum Y-11]